MSFSDLNFIFIFLPVFLAVYYLFPAHRRNLPLLAGSIVFYVMGVRDRLWCLPLLAGMLLLTWLLGLLLQRLTRGRGAVLALGLAAQFGMLLFFKYGGLFLHCTLLLPLGVSFYTFQMTAYLMDVYRGELAAERSLQPLCCNFLFFPKLLSGPLMDYGQLQQQLQQRAYSLAGFDSGLRDFILGLGLKTLLADRIGGLWRQLGVIGFDSLSSPMAALGLLSYSLQLYFDFYAYSKMAVGVGRMLGFSLPENFLHPYGSRSMSEFWRRWHVTLGLWFRKYVYIPLGGNRRGLPRQIVNLLAVWLLTGMWHGSTANFLLWGGLLFLLIALEKLGLKTLLDRCRPVSVLYMVPAILLSWMLFAIPDLQQLQVYVTRLFCGFGDYADVLHYGGEYGLLLAAGTALSLPFANKLWLKVRDRWMGTVALLAVFWLAIYTLSAGLNDPFMYFNF